MKKGLLVIFLAVLSGFMILSAQCAEPDFNKQWGLRNTTHPGVDISILQAWELAKGKGVTIAVIDWGIDKEHLDLKANMHSFSYDATTASFPNNRKSNHGTHCAGIAAAAMNGKGMAGVAPEAKIIDINRYGANAIQTAESINQAWQNGADVISCSWRLDAAGVGIQSNQVEDAIDMALSKGRNGKGSIVVFAAGNQKSEGNMEGTVISSAELNHGPNVSYPAKYRGEILVVAAIDSTGKIWYNSCYGKEVDVCAPGVRIYSTILENEMKYDDGTSMAAPHVAGIAALMLELNPDLTGQEVRDIIEKTAKKVGDLPYKTTTGRPNGTWNEKYGYGLVDAYAAVKAACPVTSYTNKTITQNTAIKGCSFDISNVTVKKGAKLTIEATGTVTFGLGFKVEEGAELEVLH